MSHYIYSTEAIILGEMPSGENDRLFFLMTKDLGFVMAVAAGVRLLKSKLRFHLSLFARLEVELVRGKNIWRIVNAYPKENEKFYLNSRVGLFVRLSQLVRRMVHGEEENLQLYDEINSAREILKSAELSRDEAKTMEVVAVARVLSSLGYLHAEKYPAIVSGPLDRSVLAKAMPFRRELVTDINEALNQSQL